MATEDLQTVGTAEFLEDVRFSGWLLKAHGTGPHGTGPNTQWRRRWVRQGHLKPAGRALSIELHSQLQNVVDVSHFKPSAEAL